jgi:hypothetical protein
MQPEAHELLQGITLLLVHNIKLSCVLNMLHLITNTAAIFQPWLLRSRKQNSGSVLLFIAAQKCSVPLPHRLRMERTDRNLKIKFSETLKTKYIYGQR